MKFFLFLTLFISSIFADNLTFIAKTYTKSSVDDSIICMETDKSSYKSVESIKLREYVKVIPNKFSSVEWENDAICVYGLIPDTDYTIMLHKGMPLGKLSLDKDYTVSERTPNYDSSFKFIDNGYIIFTKGDISVPIKTTNVDMLYISLYRINDRNLINVINKYSLMKRLAYYQVDEIEDTSGTLLWKKKLPIEIKTLNKAQTTAVPIGKSLKETKAGVYLLKATTDPDESGETQWFLISDIGIFTIKSKKGLHVWCRHLKNSNVYKDVTVKLISKNNQILSTAVAKDGYVFFESNLLNGTKGMKPKAIYVYGQNGDFNVLNLSSPALDLTDRGDGGRESTDDLQALVFSNRDIFKPGSRAKIVALVRDKNGNAKEKTHFLLKIYDAKEKLILKKIVTSDDIGAIEESIDIDKLSATGRWRAVLLFGSKTVGEFRFLVEDFIPTKIKASYMNLPSIIKPNDKVNFDIVAKYLNDTPLSNSSVHVTLSAKAEVEAFVGYEKYIFGDNDDSFGVKEFFEKDLKTNSEGIAKISFMNNKIFDTTKPISIIYKSEVSELGGRPIIKWAKSLYLNQENYIGIKPLFEDDTIDLSSKAIFDIVYLHDAQPTAKKLHYKIQKEIVDWNWRTDNYGDWDYYKTYTLGETIDKGEILVSDTSTVLKLNKLDWGDYRLELSDDNGTLSSYIFSSGYEGSRSKTSPDRLPISIDKKAYKIGEKVEINVTPKFKGPVEIFVANSEILEKKTLNANGKDKIKLSFDVNKSWGSSVYILATAFRSQSKKLGASRAVGLTHIKIDRSDKIVNVKLTHKKEVKSKSNLHINIEAPDMKDEKTVVKISAVDEGILSLTNYQIPNPAEYFFTQQKLGLEIKDIYSNIIKTAGEHAEFQVGAGDSEENKKELSTQNKRKIVALFTKDIVFKDGKAQIDIDIPDYQGALKLTAVVWSKNSIGYTESKVIIKDDISLEYYMPRFVTVGDKVETLLSIAVDKNVSQGKYKVDLTSDKGINLNPNSFEFTVDKDGDKIFTKAIELNATVAKDVDIKAKVYKDGKTLSQREWKLAIKRGSIPLNSKKLSTIESNNSLNIDLFIDTSIYKEISDMHLKISGKPLFSKKELIEDLILYRGRCTEQTTSRAFGLLYTEISKEHKTLISSAINRLMKYQHMNGSFSLWDESRQDIWLTAYVVDFLTEAKKHNFKVNEEKITKALDWIEANLNRFSNNRVKIEADIYGLYVLTKNSRVLISELRAHLKDNSELNTQSLAQLAASFSLLGDKKSASTLFEKAKNALSISDKYFDNYGGALRDEASLVTLLESVKDNTWKNEIVGLANMLKDRKYFSTQEMSTLLRAFELVKKQNTSNSFKISINGKEINASNSYELKDLDVYHLPTIKNLSDSTLWLEVAYKGVVNQNYFDKVANNKLSINKTLYTLDGKKADLNNLIQNHKYICLLNGTIGKNDLDHLLITDYIPSGLELINPNIEGSDIISASKVNNLSRSEHKEYRDDRFTNALEKSDNTTFRSAFALRAVTKGNFVYLPAKIEDMYQSEYRAFSKESVKTITIKSSASLQSTPKIENNSTKAEINGSKESVNTSTTKPKEN